jgi:hypothetical protein
MLLTNTANGEGSKSQFIFVHGQPSGHPAKRYYSEHYEGGCKKFRFIDWKLWRNWLALLTDVNKAVEPVQKGVFAEPLNQH